MSYRCEKCSSVVPARTPEHRAVTETRPKKYPARREAHRLIHRLQKDRPEHMDDPGGTGREIVREVRVCSACHR